MRRTSPGWRPGRVTTARRAEFARTGPRMTRTGRLAAAGRIVALACVLIGLPGIVASPRLFAGPTPVGPPTPVELTVVGGPGLNPNAQGRASPVVVRIFELTDTQRFESADYAALFEHPGESLQHDVASQEEFVLRPGDIHERNRSAPSPVLTLGVAAAFRDLEHSVWRLTVPLKPGERNFVLIDVDQNTIRLVTLDPGRP